MNNYDHYLNCILYDPPSFCCILKLSKLRPNLPNWLNLIYYYLEQYFLDPLSLIILQSFFSPAVIQPKFIVKLSLSGIIYLLDPSIQVFYNLLRILNIKIPSNASSNLSYFSNANALLIKAFLKSGSIFRASVAQ